MPLVDGLAAVEEPRLALLIGGAGLAPPKGPAGREIRSVMTIQARTWAVGQTSAHMGRGPDLRDWASKHKIMDGT